jgi:type I restriction enzyme, S subunit
MKLKNLPNGWSDKSFDEVAILSRGHNPPKSEFIYKPKEGYVRFYQIRDGKSDNYEVYVPETSQLHRVEPDDILMVAYRHIGRVFRGASGAFNVALCKIQNKDHSIIDDDYLFYIIPTEFVRGELMKQAERSLIPSMSVKHLAEIRIPVPPIDEQRRIVAIVDQAFEAIDVAIENTKQNLANARELFESYLNDIFDRKGDKWKWVTLSDIATSITDGNHQPPPKSQSGIPFITISNINKQDRKIDFSSTFKVSPEYFESLKENWKPRKGDLLYTVTGSYGIPVLVDQDIDFCFQRHIGLIKPNTHTNSKCLYYMFLSRCLLKQADDCATGTAQKTVSLGVLRKFSVPKIPQEEQRIIVAELDILSEQTQRLEAIYRQKLAALTELKQSILQKAFTGELTADREAP